MKRLALFAVSLLCACSSEPRESSGDSSLPQPVELSDALPDSVSTEWRVLNGTGFRLRYPSNATVSPGRSHPNDWQGTAIRGPLIHVSTEADQGPSDGPAYQLVVSTLPKSGSQTLDTWVDSLVSARNATLDPDWRLDAPDSVLVGASRGLQLRPGCGDCDPYEVYLARGEVVVVLSYLFDAGFPGDRERQKEVYRLMLSTFEWVP